MNILQALNNHLINTTSITSYTSQRIYPMMATPGKAKPYITVTQISHVPEHAMVNDAKISMYRFQISSWTTAFNTVIGLSTQIKSTLRDLSGTLGTSNFQVQRIFFDSESDFPEINPDSMQIVYHRAQDYLIWTTG